MANLNCYGDCEDYVGPKILRKIWENTDWEEF
jgi:hypothetical protein